MRAVPAKGTILLVEDEPAVKGLFAQALRREGYAVYEARDGVEPLEVEKTIEHSDQGSARRR